VPEQHLHAVAALADEREQMPAEWIERPALNDGEQTVVARAHVHRLRRQVDAHLRGE
jgi:hypothetical protein